MLKQAPPPVPGNAPPPVPGRTNAPPPPGKAPPPPKPAPPANATFPIDDEPEEKLIDNGTLIAMSTSFGVSLLAHLVIFSMLAFWILRTEIEDYIGINSTIETKKPTSKLETLKNDLAPLPVFQKKEQASKRTIVPITKTGPVGGIEIDIEDPLAGTPNPGVGAGGKGKLFGTGRSARSTVFVVDCSSSMTGRRFSLAISELIRAVNRLKSSQKFYVIFYSSETIPLFATPDSSNVALPNGKDRKVRRFPIRRPARRTTRKITRRLLPASPGNKKRAEAWIKRIRPAGGTRPAEAMQIALRMRPEVIYFLTDGAIPFNTPQIVRENNKHDVRVNTVALGFAGSEDLLKQIARENNKGTYTFVDE